MAQSYLSAKYYLKEKKTNNNQHALINWDIVRHLCERGVYFSKVLVVIFLLLWLV